MTRLASAARFGSSEPSTQRSNTFPIQPSESSAASVRGSPSGTGHAERLVKCQRVPVARAWKYSSRHSAEGPTAFLVRLSAAAAAASRTLRWRAQAVSPRIRRRRSSAAIAV